jgi:hypothetical protein
LTELPDLPDGELPEPVVAELDALYEPALAALRETIGATITKRLDLTCPGCGHKFRKQTQVPNPKARLDAARFITEQTLGRAAPKPPEKDPDEERIIFRRITVAPTMREVTNRALDLQLISPDSAKRLVESFADQFDVDASLL